MNQQVVCLGLLLLMSSQNGAVQNSALGAIVPFPSTVPVGELLENRGGHMESEFTCANYGTIWSRDWNGDKAIIDNLSPFGVIQNQPGGRVHNFGDLNNAGRIENWAKYPALEPGENPGKISRPIDETLPGVWNRGTGNLYSSGWIWNNGMFFNDGYLENTGLIQTTYYFVNNTGTAYEARIENLGDFHNSGVFDNFDTFWNSETGHFLTSGTLVQKGGVMYNDGTFEIWGLFSNSHFAELYNFRDMTNYSRLFNDSYICNYGTFRNQGTIINGALIQNFGTFLNEGGMLGDGFYEGELTNSGNVNPGSSAGVYTVDGNYIQTADGSLTIEIGGTGAGLADQLVVTGNANLDGKLNLVFLDGFAPSQGDVFDDLITFGAWSGDFAEVTVSGIQPGWLYEPVFDSGGLTIRSLSNGVVPEPASLAIWSLIGLSFLGAGWYRRRAA